MDFEEWDPIYRAILADFGYEREEDERARDVLGSLTTPAVPDIHPTFRGKTVAVAGAGPSLDSPEELERVRNTDRVIAASTAVDRLEKAGVRVDCMVTDLDKNPDTVVDLTERATPVVIHAHGDNIPSIRSIVPNCVDQSIIPTTQAKPRGHVRNTGGFTDGDRAAFLADHLGASRLCFVGWDFDDPDVAPGKARKLEWAQRLLLWLEQRRDERFNVLDGRRSGIESPVVGSG